MFNLFNYNGHIFSRNLLTNQQVQSNQNLVYNRTCCSLNHTELGSTIACLARKWVAEFPSLLIHKYTCQNGHIFYYTIN